MRDYAGTLPVYLDLDLVNAGWNGTINPYPGIHPRTVAMQSLRKSLLKKFKDVMTPKADANALELFLKINSRCSEWKLETSSMNEVETIALGEARDFIYRFFFPDNQETCDNTLLTYGKITDGFGLGNGANIGSFSTDFLSKVGTSTMAATSSKLHSLYLQAVSQDPIWSSVESTRSEARGMEIVRGSRLSFVPKTSEISRTICTEPVCNMLFQKGLALILEQRLQQMLGIDLTKQPDKNRELARLGSLTGRFGTIDLSSASDSMSLGLVKYMFPKQVVSLLEMCRSPVTILPDGTEVELHMVSSMGNAFTFPLQTLLFSSLVIGAYRALDISIERPFRSSLGSFAVFGDDIIVVKKAYDLVSRLLMLCGFSVNDDKSFNEGFFRESCGHDYWYGHNVRGIYIKSLKNVSDRYSTINRLNHWSARWGVPLCHTVSYIMKGLRFLPVPFDEMDTAGIKVPVSLLKKKILHKHTGGLFYRYLHIDESSHSVTDVSVKPPRLRGWVNNPDAVLLAALAGTLRSGKVVTRSSRQSTRYRRRYSSCWDYIFTDRGVSRDFDERWKFFVELNLNFS